MPRNDAISMYVPARNAARTLKACIDSIHAQTRRPDELFIVVDPHSDDDTVNVARSTGVEIIEQTGNTLGAARNDAIRHARYPWLASCDSDVTLEPDWLQKLTERRKEGINGVGGRTLENTQSQFDEWRALHMPHHWGEKPFRNPFMLVSEVIFNRRALRAVGGYRDDLSYYEDSDLCQRLRDAGYDLFYEPAATASHQRTDDLVSLLTLRWKYSEYRQKHLLDRLAGLVEKTRINREYAVNTLAKSMARGREELTYISFLLFFHHAVMDLRSLMSRRPLLSNATRFYYERELVMKMVGALGEEQSGLARAVLHDLGELASDATVTRPRTEIMPGWNGFLDRIGDAVREFCGEFCFMTMAIIESSSWQVHGRMTADAVYRWPTHDMQTLQAELDEEEIQPFVDEGFVASIRQDWPTGPIHIVGRATPEEHEAVNGQDGQTDTAPVALIPHLEARSDPLRAFDELSAETERVIACYQPPKRFIPGQDVMSASDLASAAAAAGWNIERFDTLVGRTRLMLSRPNPAPAPATT